MRPCFPLMLIDLDINDPDLLEQLCVFDDFYYSKDEIYYQQNLHGKKYLDSKSLVFIADSKMKVNDLWSRIGVRQKHQITYVYSCQKH